MNTSRTFSCFAWGVTYLIIGLIYCVTWSSVPVSDGFVWVDIIDHQNWEEIFRPFHLLPLAFIASVKSLLTQFLRHNTPTLHVIQCANLISIFISIHLFRRFLYDLFTSNLFAWIGTILFAFAFSVWHFANGEIHHFALIFLLAILVKLKEFYKSPRLLIAIQIGLLHGIAIACHQEHLLFGAFILCIMLSGEDKKLRMLASLIYLCTLTAFLVALFSIFAVQIYKLDKPSQWLSWFFQIQQSGKESDYHYFEIRKTQLLYWVKGFAMSFNYGAQVVVDSLRYGKLCQLIKVRVLLIETIIGLVLTGFLIAKAIFGIGNEKIVLKKVFFIGILVWLLIYQSLFNFRYTPESPEYYIGSIIPLICLLLFGLDRFKSRNVAILTSVTLFILTFSVNFFGGALPWKQHGEMLDCFRSFSDQHFRKDDLFISTESNLDLVILGRFEHLSLKKLYLENKKEESFKKVKNIIDLGLRQNRRIFIYNVIPSKYAIKRKTNKQDIDEMYSIEDLKKFLNDLQSTYRFSSVYEYWESTTSQIYLFGHQNDFVWQIQKK